MVAFGLRLSAMGQSLYGDEVFAYQETAHGLGTLFDNLGDKGAEVSPPLFFVLAWAARRLGEPTVLIRLPSLIFGTASCAGRLCAGSSSFRNGRRPGRSPRVVPQPVRDLLFDRGPALRDDDVLRRGVDALPAPRGGGWRVGLVAGLRSVRGCGALLPLHRGIRGGRPGGVGALGLPRPVPKGAGGLRVDRARLRRGFRCSSPRARRTSTSRRSTPRLSPWRRRSRTSQKRPSDTRSWPCRLFPAVWR